VKIRASMDHIEAYTCIRFRERQREPDFILIYSGDGCYSFMGKVGKQQVVSLKRKGCFKTYGTVIHELVHAIGFDHQQNSRFLIQNISA
jgi:Astacin (Peptidase family M12A)